MGVLGLALGTQALIGMTAAWTDLNSRVFNAAGSVEKGSAVMERLVSVANRTYSSLDQTAEGYLQNAQALSAMGYSTQQQLDLTEALNNSLVISATRGDKARSVMDAWSKAMAGGKLSGDNLNTIIQSGGRLSKALADSMGISVNQLRQWGSEGKITTDVMYGVTSQLETLRAEADKMPATIQDGITKLGTAMLKFVGEADKAAGVSSSLAESLLELAKAIDRMPKDNALTEILKWSDDLGNQSFEGTRREWEGLVSIWEKSGDILQYMGRNTLMEGFQDAARAMQGLPTKELEQAIGDVEYALREVAVAAWQSISPGEAGEKMAALAGEFINGKKTAEEAKAALVDMGKGNPDLGPIIGRLWTLVDTLSKVRAGAIDAANAVNLIPESLSGPVNSRSRVGAALRRQAARNALETDGATGGPVKPITPGSGSKKQTPAQRFDEDLTQYARKIEMLKEETWLTAHLGHAPNVTNFVIAERNAA
jgi:tape measure domain-containing protein